jgi:hypothetical protein
MSLSPKYPGGPFEQLRLPLGDLVWADLKMLRQFSQSIFRTDWFNLFDEKMLRLFDTGAISDSAETESALVDRFRWMIPIRRIKSIHQHFDFVGRPGPDAREPSVRVEPLGPNRISKGSWPESQGVARK